MFTNYSNPALAGILKPPHAQWSDISQGAIHVDPLARTLIPILLGCALVLAMLYYGVAAVKNSTRVKFETARLKKAWKPFVLRHSFLIFVFLQTTCLIALLTLLRERSQAPDPDPWRKNHSLLIRKPGSLLISFINRLDRWPRFCRHMDQRKIYIPLHSSSRIRTAAKRAHFRISRRRTRRTI